MSMSKAFSSPADSSTLKSIAVKVISMLLTSSRVVLAGCRVSIQQTTTTLIPTLSATLVPGITTSVTTTTGLAPIDTGTGISFTVDFPRPGGTSPPYMLFYNNVKYTNKHLWVRQESPDTVRIGFTDYGQAAIGPLWYLILPEPGTLLNRGFTFGFVQGEDTQDINFTAPVSGIVLEVNRDVLSDFYLIHQSPYDAGWLILVRMSNPDDLNLLLTAAEYARTCCPPCHCNN
jgi:glycine cleavage system H protein